jgi:hypothetical protein
MVWCGFVFGLVGPRAVRFVAEDVEFHVVEEEEPALLVDGRYSLSNRCPLPVFLPIRFPLSRGDRKPSPADVHVEVDGRDIPTRGTATEAFFRVFLSGRSDAVLRVRYRQELISRRGEYAVMTTHDWGRPLEEARFRVVVPAPCALTSATEPFDPRTGLGFARDFWPTRDLAFEWSCAPRAME